MSSSPLSRTVGVLTLAAALMAPVLAPAAHAARGNSPFIGSTAYPAAAPEASAPTQHERTPLDVLAETGATGNGGQHR